MTRSPTFFVAGTDTGVGKTRVACGLLHAASRRGMVTLGFKPVAAGCRATAAGLRNADAEALLAASTLSGVTYEQVNPVALEAAVAPHIAAREAGVELSAGDLAAACGMVTGADFTLVEGAGGWRVPLNGAETLADVPRRLGIPVVLVVGLRLGCINHALLTAEAIRADGLEIAGWVANLVDPDMARQRENIEALEARLQAPCLGRIPHVSPPVAAGFARHLDVGLLLGSD